MDAYLARSNFKKNWVFGSLTNGNVSVFNRHYDGYSLVVLKTATLNEDIANIITVIHLKDFKV